MYRQEGNAKKTNSIKTAEKRTADSLILHRLKGRGRNETPHRRQGAGARKEGEDMKYERFGALQEKEVINICDGRRLGCVCDLELDLATGQVCTLIIPEEGSRWHFFGKERAYFVPWRCIRRIGDDIVLVEVDPTDILRGDGMGRD